MLKLAGELIEGQLADHMAILDAHTKSLAELIRVGQYFYPYPGGNTTTNNLAADTLFTDPVWIARDMTIDRLAVAVSNAASGGESVRLGIYHNGTNLYPGSLLLDAGEVSVATTGVKTITVDQSLTKGLYWLAVLVEGGSPVLRFIVPQYPLMGLNAALAAYRTGWKVSQTYGSLPDPFTGGGSAQQYVPTVFLRLSSLD